MDKNSKLELRTGNKIPVMGLGTWLLTQNTAEIVEYALELGYRLIDTSSDYETQLGIGEAIKNSKLKRKDLYICTKVEETDDAYERVKSNLAELGLKYADLILIHRPPIVGAGENLWQGLIRARDEGLTKDIGVSNYPINLIEQLITATGETPAVNQIEWSPFGYSNEMKNYCERNNIFIMAYSPLTRATKLDDPVLNQIADKYGKTAAQVLIRWNLQIGVVPIPKANKKQHLKENLNVFDFELTGEDIAALDNLNEDYSALGSLPYL